MENVTPKMNKAKNSYHSHWWTDFAKRLIELFRSVSVTKPKRVVQSNASVLTTYRSVNIRSHSSIALGSFNGAPRCSRDQSAVTSEYVMMRLPHCNSSPFKTRAFNSNNSAPNVKPQLLNSPVATPFLKLGKSIRLDETEEQSLDSLLNISQVHSSALNPSIRRNSHELSQILHRSTIFANFVSQASQRTEFWDQINVLHLCGAALPQRSFLGSTKLKKQNP